MTKWPTKFSCIYTGHIFIVDLKIDKYHNGVYAEALIPHKYRHRVVQSFLNAVVLLKSGTTTNKMKSFRRGTCVYVNQMLLDSYSTFDVKQLTHGYLSEPPLFVYELFISLMHPSTRSWSLLLNMSNKSYTGQKLERLSHSIGTKYIVSVILGNNAKAFELLVLYQVLHEHFGQVNVAQTSSSSTLDPVLSKKCGRRCVSLVQMISHEDDQQSLLDDSEQSPNSSDTLSKTSAFSSVSLCSIDEPNHPHFVESVLRMVQSWIPRSSSPSREKFDS